MAFEEVFKLKGVVSLEGGEEVVQKSAEIADQTAQKVEQVEQKVRQKSIQEKDKEGQEAEAKQQQKVADSLSQNLQSFKRNQLVSSAGQFLTSPTGAISTSDLGSQAGFALTGLAPQLVSAISGPIGGVIAQAMTGPLNLFIDRFFAERKAIESQAGAAVQGRVRQFAEQGIDISGEDIGTLLDVERQRAERIVGAMKQVSKVQDLTNNSIEGIFSSLYRRTVDSLIG